MSSLNFKKIKKKYLKAFNFFHSNILYGVGTLKNDFVVRTYWYDAIVNFGDLLTPILLKHYGVNPIHFPVEKSNIIVVGSVLDIVPDDYAGYIVGTGLIRDIQRELPLAKILALRGELTRGRINAPITTMLGDPGLLAEKLIAVRGQKQYVLGIIPHHVDQFDKRIQKIYHRYKNEILIIDVQREPYDVILDIDKCTHVISSSLHGMVVADSLGIPNAWTILSGKVRGGGFKFYDYASAFGMRYEPVQITGEESLTDLINLTHPVYKGIPEIQQKLEAVFNEFKDLIISERNHLNKKAKV